MQVSSLIRIQILITGFALLGAGVAKAQDDGAATFTPFEGQKAWLGISGRKVDARSAPAKVASESEGNLNLKGYFNIGTISAWQPGEKENPDITRKLESAILQKAAEVGGDVVQFLVEGHFTNVAATGKTRSIRACLQGGNLVVYTPTTTRSCTTDVHGFAHCYDTTTPGYTTISTCVKWGPPEEVPVIGRVKRLVSLGAVWRYDPELASEVARKGLAARNAARITMEETDIKEEYFSIPKGFEAVKAAPATEKNFGLLHDALMFEKTDEAESLAQVADANARDVMGRTYLHYAAMYGNRNVAELLLARGADVNAKAIAGDTPLILAMRSAKKDAVELLLAHGADVSSRDPLTANTPLHMAAAIGSKDLAELLLAHGADVNAESYGWTPLKVAVKGRYQIVADLLRQHGGHK
jgi:hypothetical protein